MRCTGRDPVSHGVIPILDPDRPAWDLLLTGAMLRMLDAYMHDGLRRPDYPRGSAACGMDDVKLGNVRDLAKARGVCVRVCVPENPRGGRVQHTPGPIAGDVTLTTLVS